MSEHTERIGIIRYWWGRWRLAWRLCPLCNSSPPARHCPVCQGSYSYGNKLGDAARAKWRDRLDAMRAKD